MREEITITKTFLQEDKIILYPTDTVWGIGCDATSEDAVKKIYELKNRVESKSLIMLVDSIEMLKKYIPDIPSEVLKVLKEATKPTTIIYSNPTGLAINAIAKEENTVAIRIPEDDFCKQLIKELGKPIVSTSANVSGRPTPMSFSEIEKPILEGVDYIVNLRQEEVAQKSSTILKVEGNSIVVLRA